MELNEHLVDTIAPTKEARIKCNSQEWFDGEIADKIATRDKLFKKFKKSKLQIDSDLWNEAKKNTGKPKELWKTLKSMGLDNSKKSDPNYCLKDEDALHFDTKSKLEIFKNFFSGLADGLLQNLPKPSNRFGINAVISYYKSLNIGNKIFNFQQVLEEDVLNLLNDTSTTKAPGLDTISGIFLKDGADVLCRPITQLCNLSISLSSFPSELVHNQTQAFLDENNILFKFQSGFRSCHSTDFCLLYIHDKISKGFDAGLLSGMILIDLQKAFDTINHSILLEKLGTLGFSNEVILWFRSYLANRTFCVSIDNLSSNPGKLECGVPQGSILGPLLFLLYVNDMPQALVQCDLFLYADDSCLLFQHKDITEMENALNTDFSNLCDWFVDNKLSIHFGEDKTKSILFASRGKIKKAEKLNISYNGVEIKQHTKVKYLGCIFDQSLSVLKKKLQVAQNKCVRFCLQKSSRSHVGATDFKEINWLSVGERFKVCVNNHAYKFFQKKCPLYMSDVFIPSSHRRASTRSSFQRLEQSCVKTPQGQQCLSYLGPSLWNTLPEGLKRSSTTNSFKHNLKKHYFDVITRRDSDDFVN
ncbi:uncharacterized protein LOC130657775 [Hydractinia symbiolongicarpus]|uniref:uncharacterized protein LOC130657775 n=1 Tax=Hydractinia symbiolongicarpus TaxID=13093 RepID=UPI00254B1B31|nr:uncharacterized protein LOC130657775 [Hydractinia symbiolongicarpus]